MADDLCFRNHENCVLSREHLLYLAERTVKEWRRILSFLNVKQYIIEAVDEEAFNRNYHFDCREVAYQGYLKWQQASPKEATICSICSALKSVNRNDLVQDFQEKFQVPDFSPRSPRSGSFISVDHFVGRKVQMERIKNFCAFNNDRKLMIISGHPGVGKSELLLNAVNDLIAVNPSLNIVKPLFPSAGDEVKWTLEDIAVCILEEFKPGICVTKHRVAVLHKTLINIGIPTVLVLEMAYINFKENALVAFWHFFHCILRIDNAHLKTIISTCKSPDLSQMHNIDVERINLKDLEEDEVCELLQKMNPGLKQQECSIIFKFCGGNPFIIRKMGAHIQNFVQPQKDLRELFNMLKCNSQFDLKPFLRQTVLRNNMKILFDELEVEERETLVKLCCFNDVIPVETLNYLFGRDVNSVAYHLYQNHSVVEKRRSSIGSFYKINEITRMFVQDYSQSNHLLSMLLEESKNKLIQHYLILICQLNDLYFSPTCLDKYPLCKYLVNDYRKACKLCCYKSDCQCLLPQVLQFLFVKHKAMIMRAINLGLHIEDSNIYLETIDSCHRVVHFFRVAVSYEELYEMYDNIFERLNMKNDKVRMAITMADLVFIKVYRYVSSEKEQNIIYLTKSINMLERNRSYLSTHMLESLVYCYAHRGYLRGYYCYQFHEGKSDIKKGREVLSRLRQNSRVLIAEYFLNGRMASIFYKELMYYESAVEREIQVAGYRKLLGTHKHTAKALHYLGKTYSKLGLLNKARNCLLVAYQIYLNLNERGDENLAVLSSYAKVWIKSGKTSYGIQKLEQAVLAGENELGDHDIVAWCYEQLANAKATQSGSSLEVHELKEKAKNIRQRFEMKSPFPVRKSYSLQLSPDEIQLFSNEKFGCADGYIPFVLLIMSVVLFWHFVSVIFTGNCSQLHYNRYF